VRETVRELAVVGEEEGARRVGVEAADGYDARPVVRDELDDGRSSVGVACGAEDAGRLVKEDIGQRLSRERLPVELDPVALSDEGVQLAGSPLTVTRPALISSSAFRRDATPALAR